MTVTPGPTLHTRLRAARKANRLTLEWVAIHMDVEPSTVHLWETRTMPRFDKVVELARLYGVTLDSLAGLS